MGLFFSQRRWNVWVLNRINAEPISLVGVEGVRTTINIFFFLNSNWIWIFIQRWVHLCHFYYKNDLHMIIIANFRSYRSPLLNKYVQIHASPKAEHFKRLIFCPFGSCNLYSYIFRISNRPILFYQLFLKLTPFKVFWHVFCNLLSYLSPCLSHFYVILQRLLNFHSLFITCSQFRMRLHVNKIMLMLCLVSPLFKVIL